jgi:hypothetical protein
MKLKLLFVALMTMTLSFAQEKQVDKIIDNSKDGVSTVYNDGKEAVSTVYKDVKSMSPKVEEAVKSLAEQFKTTTNALWNILVKQQLVWSYCFLFLTLLSLYSVYKFFNQYSKTVSDVDDDGDIKQSNFALSLILGAIALSSSIVSGVHFEQMITGFVNPEFGALQTIMKIATKL